MFVQAVTFVLILIEDSFMNTVFHTRLPGGITSGAEPVQALRSRSDERAPSPHHHYLHGLDRLGSVIRIPPGGDAERAGGRRQRGTHRLRASFTVGKEEGVGTAWATPAERAAFPPTCRPSRLNLDDPVLSPFLLQGLGVSCAMVPVQFWIRED